MKTFQESNFIEDLSGYYHKAYKLEANRFENLPLTELELNDSLMWNVPIYNNVQRRYAGFSNALEAVWYGSKAPKGPDGRYASFDRASKIWGLKEWLYVFLVHRCTGSGASFESDHGWRNSVVPILATVDNVTEMADYLEYNELYSGKQNKPIFTSIGNQPPMFAKFSGMNNMRPGIYYLTTLLPELVDELVELLLKSTERKSIVWLTDYLNAWNQAHQMKRFTFAYCAFAMDVAEYFPEFIDPWSEVYAGSNAMKCLNTILPRVKGSKELDYVNEALNYCCDLFEQTIGKRITTPYSAEDVTCDMVRYLCEYSAPQFKKLDPDKLKNNTLLKQKLGPVGYYSFLSEHINKYGHELNQQQQQQALLV